MGLDWQKDRERRATKAAVPVVVCDDGYGDWLVSRYNAPTKAQLRAQADAAIEEWSRRKMPASVHGGRYSGPPMSLANMRANGVRCLIVECRGCRRSKSVNADTLPDDVEVPSAGRFFKCSVCGSKSINTRPDWTTQEKRQ